MNQYSDEEYIVRVGDTHAALVIVGDGYDRETAPSRDDVESILDDAEWGMSSVYDIREGPVEVQHESPPEKPYEAWGVVVAFEQSPTVLDYAHDGPIRAAIEALNDGLEGIEIWVDAL